MQNLINQLRMRHFKLCALLALVILCLPYYNSAPIPEKQGKGKTVPSKKVDGDNEVATTSVPVQDSDEYLIQYGYMKKPAKGMQVEAKRREKAIRKYQKMAGLKDTGFIDKATNDEMQKPRCGNPDFDAESADDDSDISRKKRYTLHPLSKWSKHDLTWRMYNYTPDITDQSKQRQALVDAMKLWSDVSSITFREVDTDYADIKITFNLEVHSLTDTTFTNSYQCEFIGPVAVAHAYYPEFSEIHFREEKQWTLAYDNGINLLAVAIHELGHSLGIMHSNLNTSVMYPTSYIGSWKTELDCDDIAAIQHLYGTATSA